ncbi:MAG TPA: hypothetical protein VNN99_17690 [Vicinamibacterales bacterium]|jgi:hypothetical protein|nr:hypothetical protein [Vicinamibacterales bacterium]
MGYGEVVGNASVHWTIVHEDEAGEPVELSPKRGHGGHHPKTGNDVHVEKDCRGCDPLSLDRVGTRKGHTGHYRVTLRYERMQDAQAAAARVQKVSEREDGMYELVIDVPVIHRVEPDDLPAPEIRIDW